MKRVIVYGVGNRWKKYNKIIAEKYTIIACSDKNLNIRKELTYRFVEPQKIINESYDYIIVCPNDYSIRSELIEKYKLDYNSIIFWDDIISCKSQFSKHSISNQQDSLMVVIPTYNRKFALLRTLHLLEQQTDDNFTVSIVDNASEYNVQEVRNELSEQFNDKLSIYTNSMNIGMCGNLANIFTFASEGWVWTLADDDLPEIKAIEIIRYYMGKYRNAGAVMFSIRKMNLLTSYNQEIELKCISDLANFYKKLFYETGLKENYSGDFIYLSNKIFNTTLCKKYISDIFKNANSGIPQVYPIIKTLDERNQSVVISNYKIVNYSSEGQDHWDFFEIALGTSGVVNWLISQPKYIQSVIMRLCQIDYKALIHSNQRSFTQRETGIMNKLLDETYSLFLTRDEINELKLYCSTYAYKDDDL